MCLWECTEDPLLRLFSQWNREKLPDTSRILDNPALCRNVLARAFIEYSQINVHGRVYILARKRIIIRSSTRFVWQVRNYITSFSCFRKLFMKQNIFVSWENYYFFSCALLLSESSPFRFSFWKRKLFWKYLCWDVYCFYVTSWFALFPLCAFATCLVSSIVLGKFKCVCDLIYRRWLRTTRLYGLTPLSWWSRERKDGR